jgi:NitT/TauT family transport system substrate-binding protein
MLTRLIESTIRSHRRPFIAAFAALSTIAGSMSAAQAADKLTMRLDWTAYVMHFPLHLAAEKGWFKAADLDVTIEDGNGTITAVQLVGNGKFDLGHGVISAMAVGSSKGLPITSVASYMRKSTLGIIYPENSSINDLKDLAGKKLIYTPASFESPFLQPFLKLNGLNVNLVGVEASAKISSYVTAVGDAVVTTVTSDLPQIVGRRPSKYFLMADHGMNLPAYGIFANTDSLKAKGPAIKRFVSVVSAAWAYILDGHEQEAIDAVLKQRPNSAVSKEHFLVEYKMTQPFLVDKDRPRFPGIQSASDWQAALDLMKKADVIKTDNKPEFFFTNDYIDADYGKKIVAGGK